MAYMNLEASPLPSSGCRLWDEHAHPRQCEPCVWDPQRDPALRGPGDCPDREDLQGIRCLLVRGEKEQELRN